MSLFAIYEHHPTLDFLAVSLQTKKKQPVQMTAEQREKSEADIKAIFAKFGDDPTDFINNLPASYKPSDANLLC